MRGPMVSAGLITVLVLAIIFAGCTGAPAPAHQVISLQDTAPAPEHASLGVSAERITKSTIKAATTQQPVPSPMSETITARIKTFTGDYSWAEYRDNITQTLPPNPRYQWEVVEKVEKFPDNYHATPAIHYRTTRTMDYPEWIGNTLMHTKNGWIIVTDRYYDNETMSFLGGMGTETIKGVKQPVTSLPLDSSFDQEAGPSGEMGITPFGEMDIMLEYAGTETVTVPAGTFPDARKYTGRFLDGTPITFWVVQGIPVPVQYQFPNRQMDGIDPFQSYELVHWG